MGCAFSKSNEERGCKRDTSKGKGPIDEPAKNVNEIIDPRVPLTARQKFSITKSWKGKNGIGFNHFHYSSLSKNHWILLTSHFLKSTFFMSV